MMSLNFPDDCRMLFSFESQNTASDVSAKYLQVIDALVSDSSNLKVSIKKDLENLAFRIWARIAPSLPK
jgi:hypothetical protein